MPDKTNVRIPPPENWQDFERLCRDLWRKIWNDPGAQTHGRGGQPQQGVDVFGRPNRGSEWAGVQCKLKDELFDGTLTRAEIRREAKKARDFNPRLSEFILATTAPCDRAAQEAARELTEEGPFEVRIASWDDIQSYLAEYPEVLDKHYPGLHFGRHSSAVSAREHYLLGLWSRLHPLQLTGISGGSSQRKDIPLAAVYTALDVSEAVHLHKQGSTESPETRGPDALGLASRRGILSKDYLATGSLVGWAQERHVDEEYLKALLARLGAEADGAAEERREDQPYGRLLTALEAAAAVRRLVLLGPAGSGKSTFARFLALSLAGEALGKSEANLRLLNHLGDGGEASDAMAWPHRGLLPFFVELRKLVRSAVFGVSGKGEPADRLLEYLVAEAPATSRPGFQSLLQEALTAEGAGALLILDGLDETPAAETHRERLRKLVASFVGRYPRSRVLLTCRPYAYEEGSSWRLDGEGFVVARLAAFDRLKVRAFVDAWYRHLALREQLGRQRAESRARRLVQEIESTPYLQPLAERPLMLTMMADLHATGGGHLPGGRAALYEESVKLLLDRWNELRDLGEAETVSEHLGMTVQQMRMALEDLAHKVHAERGAGDGSEGAEITAQELWEAIDARRDPPPEGSVDERRVMDYLHQRSGILVAESPKLYRFPHRSYQEYLAACHLVREDFPKLVLGEVRADPTLWRESLLLAVGKLAGTPFMAWTLLGGLVPGPPAAEVEADDPGFLLALYAGLAIRESELWRDIQEQDAAKLEHVRQWLQRSLEIGALPPVDRAEAGRVVAILGDRRRGVDRGPDGLPDIDWIEIPAGVFLIGSTDEDKLAHADEKPQHSVELPAYRISRFPVTCEQYRTFVEDGGYTSKWRGCWTDAGWEWKGDREGPDRDPEDRDSELPNHPQANVCWYEAHAFSRWLGERLGEEVRLPTESEWERAARGSDGRIYPWGSKFHASHCNAFETRLGRACAVGSFPTGASPDGVLDMSGNVYEWCSTKWRNSYEEDADDDPEGTASRVVRGGSFGDDRGPVRCAFRRHFGPSDAFTYLGFRVCASISENLSSEDSDL